MTSQTAISKALKWALLGSAAIAVSAPVFAADSSDSSVEKIEVTGSRIKRTDMETASPVSVITSEDMQKSGYSSVADFLNNSTFSSGSTLGASTNNGSGGNATINLRGLGANRTLVLINGRRMINSGTGASSTVDLNSIPMAMIKRIEVLKDGASAVYGSDAVAGVVNIITKNDFQGVELDGSYGGSSRGDANDGKLSLLIGGSSDKANMVIGASYEDRAKAMQTSRSFSGSCSRDYTPEGDCYGSSYDTNPTVSAGGVDEQPNSDGTWNTDKNNFEQFAFVPYQYLYTPQKRFSVFGSGSYQLTEDTQLFTEFMWTNRTSQQQLAPSALALTFPSDAIGNPAGTDVDYKLRTLSAGTRGYSQTVNTARYVIGAQGTLNVHNGLDWDISYVYGRNDATSTTTNLQNTAKVLQTADPDVCENDDSIPCANWFSYQLSGVSQEALDYVDYTDKDSSGTTMNDVTANISGDLFELPAGMFSFAAGLEYRRESAFDQPDAITVAGDSAQSQAFPTSGSYDTKQAYVELEVPVLADKFLVKSLSVEAAARYFDYSEFGSDNTWKIGITWRLNDDIMLRGVRSTAFRAPTVSELYGGESGSFDYLRDPCDGYGSASTSSTLYQKCSSEIPNSDYTYTDSQIEDTYVSSDNLKPEQADTTTLGLVWSPSFLSGFSATVDYYKIKITNAIDYVDEQDLLDKCYNNDDTSACDTLDITRSDASGAISYMARPLTNVGTEETNGVDTNVRYAFNALSLGWVFNLDSSYVGKFEQEGVDALGTLSDGLEYGAHPRWKDNASLSVSGDAWDAKWSVRYIGNMHDLNYPDYKVGTMVYHDLAGSYHFTDNTSVTVGVDNMFDRAPNYTPSYEDANTVPSAYDVLGRYFYAKFSWRL